MKVHQQLSERGARKFWTECKFGHEFTPENTLVSTKGVRRCKICQRKSAREWRMKQRRAAGIPKKGPLPFCGKGHPMSGRNLTVNADGKRWCKRCAADAQTARDRKRGVPPAVRLTPLQKRKQRVKWEGKRRALMKAQFVEYVDPLILYKRDEGICGVCGQPVFMNAFEVDHIIPLAKGGEHSYSNTQVSHPNCNRKKWAHLPNPSVYQIDQRLK